MAPLFLPAKKRTKRKKMRLYARQERSPRLQMADTLSALAPGHGNCEAIPVRKIRLRKGLQRKAHRKRIGASEDLQRKARFRGRRAAPECALIHGKKNRNAET
jgi:hypothetical protein